VTTNAKQRALLMTTYAAGLRASEVTRLKVADIDSTRMCIRIEQGKGMKDRYLPLSPRLLQHLRAYWRRQRPPLWLFPGHPSDRPLHRSGASWIYHTAKKKAGITKPGGIHTLRHCFATALLEAGTELVVIQRLMGHNSIRSTMRYLHIARERTGATTSPLDLLEFPTPPQR
jgi:site-specific recombinase XerD